MSKKNVDPLVINAVIGAATKGQTTAQIMQLTGLTEKKIHQIARDANVRLRPSAKRIPDDVKAKIPDMFENGSTRREIAMAFGISTRSVSEYIRKEKSEPETTAGSGEPKESPATPQSDSVNDGHPGAEKLIVELVSTTVELVNAIHALVDRLRACS